MSGAFAYDVRGGGILRRAPPSAQSCLLAAARVIAPAPNHLFFVDALGTEMGRDPRVGNTGGGVSVANFHGSCNKAKRDCPMFSSLFLSRSQALTVT